MEQTTSKSRTPSRCREWERNRRNKFNEAINRLGDTMKEVNLANSGPCKESDNVQLPKVEIVEKAILYLRNFLKETTQLKADIMALQVKIESFSKQTLDKKDASTQVFIGINKKKNGKYVKVLMLKKSKGKPSNEKSILNTNTPVKTTAKNGLLKNPLKNLASKILPTLLPKTSVVDKNGSDGTFVVLPAPSYILPQRPLLFPTAPPAFVLLDPNMQALNKPFPMVNRNNGDITRTTMVNILPISAYSGPLSASKVKRNNGKGKLKSNVVKKTTKTCSKKAVTAKESTNNEIKEVDIVENKAKDTTKTKESIKLDPVVSQILGSNLPSTTNVLIVKDAPTGALSDLKQSNNEIPKENLDKNAFDKPAIQPQTNITKEVETTKSTPIENQPLIKSSFVVEMKQEKKKTDKPALEKLSLDKDKENKIPSIMHVTLSENIVDGGNARLELAEEFLAASPTAAFLMSFPLVSGNRADSPVEEQSITPQNSSNKITYQKRDEVTPQKIPQTYFEKPLHNLTLVKTSEKLNLSTTVSQIQNKLVPQKYDNSIVMNKQIYTKGSDTVVTTLSSENPFLNLPMATLLPTPCTINDSTFNLDFDCSLNKPMPSQSTSYPTSSNIFYKTDPFHMKNSIYSTSNISSGHEFNSFGLYPCAMEKYSTKNKSDYSNVEENLMKIGSSRLTYDIDLGWSHKGFDFVNCSTAPNTFSKDNTLTTMASGPYSTSYTPFNPEFHIPLMTSSAKRDNPIKTSSSFTEAVSNLYPKDNPIKTSSTFTEAVSNLYPKDNPIKTSNSYTDAVSNLYPKDNPIKTSSSFTEAVSNLYPKDNPIKTSNSFTEAVSNLYPQHPNPWSEEVPFYTNTNISKSIPIKHNFLNNGHANTKPNSAKQYEMKSNHEIGAENVLKPLSHTNVTHSPSEKYTKKSQNKMHINWMTSETRSVQPNCIPTLANVKETNKPSYNTVALGQYNKKLEHNDGNYFPISMSQFPTQPVQEEIQTWPASRPAGTTEISIEPPPINLPTLVGDLALGPHDKKRSIEAANRTSHSDIQNCSNFFSVTQLMNRSTDNSMPSRYHAPHIEPTKSLPPKQTNLDNRKTMIRPDIQLSQPYYGFGDSKSTSYEMMTQYPQSKSKTSKSDKSSKTHKNNYSAEALIRGDPCTQKLPDNSTAKFLMQPAQKYNDFNAPQDSSVAQVSHFPAILDYSEHNYAGQQFSGTTLYNTSTNTISNSFYSNLMPASGNLMTGNYSGAQFTGEFMDYNQSECTYTNHKYEELKMRGNPPVFQQDKVASNYKSGRREAVAKHKLECSKKESSKKYPNKRAKVNTEIEEWNDAGHMLWPNKGPTKKHSNLVMDEMPFPNYVSNQVSQYQPEFFNSHLMSSSVQPVGSNMDRSHATFPSTSRANFNLSTIFPEITMKVQ